MRLQASSSSLLSSVGPTMGISSPTAFSSKLASVQEETTGELTPVVTADVASEVSANLLGLGSTYCWPPVAKQEMCKLNDQFTQHGV